MAFAGCITTVFKLNADKRRFSYTAFRVELDAERPEDAPTITSMKGKMEMVTDGEEKEGEQILRQTVDKCPLGLIFHKAGIKLDWALTVKKPSS
jgi:putative redox protein